MICISAPLSWDGKVAELARVVPPETGKIWTFIHNSEMRILPAVCRENNKLMSCFYPSLEKRSCSPNPQKRRMYMNNPEKL